MDEFLKMDVFFFVTTAVVLGGGILCLVALVYLIKILKSAENIMRNISEESNSVRDDIAILRAKIREEGMKVKHFMDFFCGIVSRKRPHKKSGK